MEYLPKVRATRSTHEHYRESDGDVCAAPGRHTFVMMPKQLREAYHARPLVRMRLLEGRVMIVEVAAEGLAPGLEVVTVDGVPVREYARRHVAPYVSASTRQDLDAKVYGRELLSGPIESRIKLTTSDVAGAIVERVIARVSATENSRAFEKESVIVKALPGHVAYVSLNSFASPEVADRFEASFPTIAAA